MGWCLIHSHFMLLLFIVLLSVHTNNGQGFSEFTDDGSTDYTQEQSVLEEPAEQVPVQQPDRDISPSSLPQEQSDDDAPILLASPVSEQSTGDVLETQQTEASGSTIEEGKLSGDDQDSQSSGSDSSSSVQASPLNLSNQWAAPWTSRTEQLDQVDQSDQQVGASQNMPQQNKPINQWVSPTLRQSWQQQQQYGQDSQQDSSSLSQSGTSVQSKQASQSNYPFASFKTQNGRGPAPISGSKNPKPIKTNGYNQNFLYSQSNTKPPGPYSQNPHSLPITMRYAKFEVPCTLYILHSGSRRIIGNSMDDQSITWIVQVPPKYGYASIPTLVSVHKTEFDQLAVNYINPDQSFLSIPNKKALGFISTPDTNVINTFPDDVPAHMLQIVVSGISPAKQSSSLEIRMIICYKPLSALQSQQSQQPQRPQQPNYQYQQPSSQYQQQSSQNSKPPLKNEQRPPNPSSSYYSLNDQPNFQSQQSWQFNPRPSRSQYPQPPARATSQSTASGLGSTRNPNGRSGSCTCNCQCPRGVSPPKIEGVNFVSQPLSSFSQQQQQQRRYRRRRQVDTSSESAIREN